MELGVVLRQFHADRRWEDDPLWMATGKLYGRDAVLVRTGIGPENAARAAERVLDSFSLKEVLLAGFAGGTVPTLAPTCLVACEKTMDGGDASDSARVRSVPSAKGLIDRALATGLVSGVSSAVTVARVITSAKDKLALGTRYGVELVEMEGFPLLRLAYERGVPGLMVRAVLDGSDDDLPDSTNWLSASGRVRVPALLAYLATHPTYFAPAVRLYDRAKNCQRSLHRFTEAYLCGDPTLSSSPK
jgi:adenosylhomocysteine nucleosidase